MAEYQPHLLVIDPEWRRILTHITRSKFRVATGFPPEQDDLERCNCDKAGQLGHFHCGWDEKRDLPNFWPKFPLQGAVTAQHRKRS